MGALLKYTLKIAFVWFWLRCVFTAGQALVVARGGYSLIMVCGPLIAAASLAAEHRL